jgi:signal transduction histidine kinase
MSRNAFAEHSEIARALAFAPRLWLRGVRSDAWRRYTFELGLLVALYYGSAHLGYAFEFAGPVAAIVWLPVGVGIAFLYLRGLKYWPGIVVGDLLVNNYSALPLGSAFGQTCGNLLEVVVACALLRRLCPGGSTINSVSSLIKALVSIAMGTAVSATIGTLSLHAGHVLAATSVPHVWRTWWLGDFSGALIVLPLALAWSRPPPRPWRLGQVLEGAAMLGTVAALSDVAFHTSRPLTYLVFPSLIWAALRFGQQGATVAIAVTVGFTLWGTTHNAGPFRLHSLNQTVLETQLYIAVAALSTLFLGALVSERKQIANNVRASRSRLIAAADAERRRLERDLHDGAQQRLVALGARLGIARREVSAAPETAPALFADAEADVLRAVDELREIAHGIHPPVLAQLGLLHAVETVVARSAIPVELVAVTSERLNRTAEVTAYYFVLEAITNAQRHSRASSIRVQAAIRSNLQLEVYDDGIGGAVERVGGGLQGLRDRVEATGGRFIVESEPGRGTRIAATIPARVRRRP